MNGWLRFGTCLWAMGMLACGKSKAEVDAGAAQPEPEPSTRLRYAAPSTIHPQLGVLALELPIWDKPQKGSTKLGTLRMGELVPRKAEPASKAGCSGGFYEIEPTGFVCVDEEGATLDLEHPILRASRVRPNRELPLPYAYAFVRAVAPQYLRIPTKDEQLKSEMSLTEHLDWYGRHHQEIDSLDDGANDVDLPALFPRPKLRSSQLALGQRYGAEDDFDPLPFWLEGGKRSIPNVSTFKVPPYAIFADRTRRYTGLSLVGAVRTGEESMERPFAITQDLRLVPITKLKPTSGSAWHGVEVDGTTIKLPFAWVRTLCDPKKSPDSCAHLYKVEGEGFSRVKRIESRKRLDLTGNAKNFDNKRYRELSDGYWMRADDLAAVMPPNEWPSAAGKDEKWIDVSIANQTLVLWKGKTPLFATMVSTGQDGLGDPKTSKSTVRGEFRIKNKFITSTMDSNERTTPETRNPEEGKTIRRGANNFELRDVPYVQFFEGAFALHTAYWHDVFGQPRSHGCVNISPVDNLRVFEFTEPQVPPHWHGLYVTDPKQGTTVYVHR